MQHKGYCEGTKIALAEPIATLFGNGQKLDEVYMEKKTFYYTSMNDRGRKNAPLTPRKAVYTHIQVPTVCSLFIAN